MEKYGIKVELLSRLKSVKEQTDILKRIKAGEVDVVVGTHKLLSSDVKFKELGLLIIDEEHRFGVEHKERIKKYKNNIDVLSMTATPIPRTLHMSMLGIRDISIILEPPLERLPVHTYVLEYDEDIVKEAIEKELSRDGQVFYISNRVDNIGFVTEKVKKLVPRARVEYAHGQMNSKSVENVMMDYINHKLDVIVCTLENIYNLLEKDKLIDIKDRTKKLLKEDKKNSFLSQELATIDTNVPMEISIENLSFPNFDINKVIKFFKQLDFHSLIKKLDSLDSSSNIKNQSSLFDTKFDNTFKKVFLEIKSENELKKEIEKFKKDDEIIISQIFKKEDFEKIAIFSEKTNGIIIPLSKINNKLNILVNN
jgi:hypothetical protein